MVNLASAVNMSMTLLPGMISNITFNGSIYDNIAIFALEGNTDLRTLKMDVAATPDMGTALFSSYDDEPVLNGVVGPVTGLDGEPVAGVMNGTIHYTAPSSNNETQGMWIMAPIDENFYNYDMAQSFQNLWYALHQHDQKDSLEEFAKQFDEDWQRELCKQGFGCDGQ